MAVKIAKAMGAEVTVLSQSLRKQDDGLRLGADDYYATSDGTFERARRPLRSHHQHRQRAARRSALPGLLKTDGALVNVGAPPSRCR